MYKPFSDYTKEEFDAYLKRVVEKTKKEAEGLLRAQQLMIVQVAAWNEVWKNDNVFDIELTYILRRTHCDQTTLLLATAKINSKMPSTKFLELKLKNIANTYLDKTQYRYAMYFFTEEIKKTFPKNNHPEEDVENMRAKEIIVDPRNLDNWVKELKNQEK